jgi:hypothetical protein
MDESTADTIQIHHIHSSTMKHQIGDGTVPIPERPAGYNFDLRISRFFSRWEFLLRRNDRGRWAMSTPSVVR